MSDSITRPINAELIAGHTATTRQVRGSSLLLVGRICSAAMNFATQILVVRYLTKSDYGAFAYGLSVASLGTTVALLGLDKAITVFVPVYQEKGDYPKVFGTIFMMTGLTLAVGFGIVLLIFGYYGLISEPRIGREQEIAIVLILIALAPLQALDALLVGMFAVFARARAIFFRRNLLGPGLQLGVVLLLVLNQSNVRFLAVGYLCAGILGVGICALTLFRILRQQAVFEHFSPGKIEMPGRAVFAYAAPLLASDLVFLVRGSLIVVMLEYFRGTTEVAAFGAVVPVAMQNLIVFQSFRYLFTPAAARLFARSDLGAINHLYWQSAVWIAVISFPIFALTFSLARPVTILLFGTRYEQSALLLALLSLGHYFNAALGFNGLTLRVFGKVRYLLCVDLLVAAASLCISVLLIMRYGAIGAAIGTCVTLVAQNILYHFGLRAGTGISLFKWRYLRVYVSIALASLALLMVQTTTPSLHLNLAAAALASLLVVRINRASLDIGRTFPELLRFPLVRRLVNEA